MPGLGGVIGAGLFAGSGAGIAVAGPGRDLVYDPRRAGDADHAELIVGPQLRLRRRIEREAPHTLSLRMWGFPWPSWAALPGMGAVPLPMPADTGARRQVICRGRLPVWCWRHG